jgi:hypothetical protein
MQSPVSSSKSVTLHASIPRHSALPHIWMCVMPSKTNLIGLLVGIFTLCYIKFFFHLDLNIVIIHWTHHFPTNIPFLSHFSQRDFFKLSLILLAHYSYPVICYGSLLNQSFVNIAIFIKVTNYMPSTLTTISQSLLFFS